MTPLDHDALAAFAAFAASLNFTHAARALHLSQPALFARIQRLTEQVGAPLYVRQGRRLALTDAGARVAAFARDLEEDTRHLLDAIHGADAHHPVVLATGEGALLYLLPEALAAFVHEHQHALRVLSASGPEARDAVLAGRAHLGVGAANAQHPDLALDHLRRVAMVLITPAEHPLACRDAIAISDLDGLPLIAPPTGRPLRSTLDEAFERHHARLHVAVEASGWEPMLRLVAHGLGVAVVNDLCRVPEGCVARPLPDLPSLDYALLRRRARTLPAAPTRLRELILLHARRHETTHKT